MNLKVIPTGKPVGAEIQGIDLGEGFDDATFEQIRAALYKYGVVFLRDQRITRSAHVEISRRLGKLRDAPPETDLLAPGCPDVMRLSNIRENGKLIGHIDAGYNWHTDQCYRECPNAHAVMYAVEVPHDDAGNPLGGTMFVNMAYAYETLPQALKERLKPLRVVQAMHNKYFDVPVQAQHTHYRDLVHAVHPLVRAHPHTGVPCLFASERYSESIEGWPERESRELLEQLFRHSTREEVRYVHHWKVGDLLFWDDCMVLHHAIPDYAPSQRRLMERTLVVAPRTVAAFPEKMEEMA